MIVLKKKRMSGLKSGLKSGSLSGLKSGKPKGSPRPEPKDGCPVHDGWSKNRHVYTMFGKPMECCVKCGKENPMITEWRAGIASGLIENKGHPYVVAGYWSLDEYKKAMKKGGNLR